MGLKYFMVPHKFSMVVTLENFKAEKLLNMKGTKVRCEITRGTKMVCTYWEPAGAVTPGVVQFDQQMQQTVTLYKGNTKWNPKYYEFKLVSISNEYGKKTLATTSINLAQLASLDPDSPVKKDLALPVEGKVVGKLNVILECKYKSIGVKKQGTPSEAASDTDFELMEKPKITKPLAALMEEELIEEEEGSSPIPAPAPRSPSPIPAPSTTAMSPVKENVYATQPARASPVVSALKSNDDKASPARSPRDVSFKQNKAITKAGSFLVFHPVKYEVVKKNKGLRIPFIPLLAITAAGVAAALKLNDGNDHARRCGTKHKVKRGDSVHALGKKYGVSTKELLALNKTVQEPGSKAAQRKGSQLIEGEQLCVRV